MARCLMLKTLSNKLQKPTARSARRARGLRALLRSGHAAAKAQHEVQGALLLDVAVGQEGAAVLELLARENQALLVRDAPSACPGSSLCFLAAILLVVQIFSCSLCKKILHRGSLKSYKTEGCSI